MFLAAACGGDRPGAAGYEDMPQGGNPSVPATPDPCATPNVGCPCAEARQVVECGHVARRSGDYVSCSMGERTCGDDLVWGECIGDGQRYQLTQSRGLSPLAYGPVTPCNDPCDPYCNRYIDTPVDEPVPPGFAVTDAGTLQNEEDPNSIEECTGIEISGPTELTVTELTPSVSPNTLAFSVALVPTGCYVGALPNAAWSLEASKVDRAVIVGSGQTGTLTVVNPVVGPIDITARLAGFTAMTTANIKVNAGPALGTSTLPDDLTILYPYEETVFPLRMTPPIVQWTQGTTPTSVTDVAVVLRYPAGSTASDAAFEWRGTQGSETASLAITTAIPPANTVVSLAAGRRFPNIPTAVWRVFEDSAKGNDADIILRRQSGGTFHEEKPVTIRFAQGQLKGALYYQSYGTQLARNFAGGAQPNVWNDPTFPGGVFGAATLAIRPGATAPTVVAGMPTSASDTSGASCRVCHTAAANGSVLVTQKFGGGNYSSMVASNLSAATPTLNDITSYSDGRTGWPGIYPDGTRFFSTAGIKNSYNSGPSPGGLDGTDNNAFRSALYTLTAAGTAAIDTAARYQTSGGSLLTVSPTAGTGVWGLKATTPVFSPAGTSVAFVHSAAVCTSSTGCNSVETRAGDQRSIGALDFDPTSKRFSNFRIVVDQPATPCNTSFNAVSPCTNVWPTFLPNGTAIVFEKEIFHNGNVGAASAAVSDFAGTRSGCDANNATCNNDGTKAELWWASTVGSPLPTRLNRANGLTAGGAIDIPTGATDPTCFVGSMLCTTDSECCSNHCSGSGLPGGVKMCAGIKRYAGNVCTSGSQCDSGTCTSGVCAGTKPTPIAQPYLFGHSAEVEPFLNYEPTVNPEPTYDASGNPEYYWVLFTSRRLFGNIATVNPFWSDPRRRNISKTVTPKKLWVAAVSANPTPGTDPSFPAFYLPGQEWISGNSKAYWVQDPCIAASSTRSTATECQSNQDCCGAPSSAVCSVQTPVASPAKRHCVPVGACVAEGGSCASDADCCGGIFCSNGTCQDPPDIIQYNPATFTRDFEGVCPTGKRLVWRFFDYQAVLPTDTSIRFSAVTAETLAELDGASPSVEITVATPPSTTAWTTGASTVDDLLESAGSFSKQFLRVTMEFFPSADKTQAPELLTWRQSYDCLDNE